jgi:hypothetical protein
VRVTIQRYAQTHCNAAAFAFYESKFIDNNALYQQRITDSTADRSRHLGVIQTIELKR